jgi:transcriptional regulator with XRE-family HTH domain
MTFDASAAFTIGAKIQKVRFNRAWSQEELADRARISLNTLQRIETGRTQPRTLTIQKIAQACKIDPAELTSLPWLPFGVNGNIEGEEFVQSAAKHDEVAKLADQIARIIMMLNRRGAMQAMAGAVLTGTVGQEDALQSIQYGLEGRKVGPEIVEWAREQIAGLKRLDVRLGGEQLYTVARSNLALLQTLLQMRAASGQDERDLRLVLAHTASQAGWFAEDSEQLDLASQHYHFGLEMARSVSSENRVVYCQTRLAAVELAKNKPRQCLSQLWAAEVEASGDSPWHSFIQMFAVEAQGRLGDLKAANLALSKADALYDKRWIGRMRELHYEVPRPSSSAIAARSFIQHDPQLAVRLSENALAQTPAEFTRARLHLSMGLAKAKLKLGEMDEAISHASEVLQGVAVTPAPRVEKLLTKFNAQLPDDPVASDFKERFAAHKRTLNA